MSTRTINAFYKLFKLFVGQIIFLLIQALQKDIMVRMWSRAEVGLMEEFGI